MSFERVNECLLFLEIMINILKFIPIVWMLLFLDACLFFKYKDLNDPRFSSGKEYGTNKKIEPKEYQFGDYSFITGHPNFGGNASLGMYFRDKEILYQTTSDNEYDSILITKLNNDSIPDFLVINAYEDGSTLSAIISKSIASFTFKDFHVQLSDYYCGNLRGDTSKFIVPITIKDINHDGDDDVIVNLVKMNGQVFGIACTDTIYTRIKVERIK